MKLEKGLIQIYTGDGKGKTTAAIGQGIRAYGNGLKVVMVQFLKGGFTGELNTINELGENFKIYRFEKEKDFFWNLSEEEKQELRLEIKEGFDFVNKVVRDNDCDVLIIDEIMGVLHNKLIDEDEVVKLINAKPEKMELILTGRNVPKNILDNADLVTEMKMIKHYFEKGVNSRKGIEY